MDRRVDSSTGQARHPRGDQPGGDGQREDHQRLALHRRERSERGKLGVDVRFLERQPLEFWGKHAQEKPPPERNHQQRRRHAEQHPLSERNGQTRQFLQIAQRDQIRGGAGRGGDAADQRTVRARDHQRPAEVALERLEPGVREHADAERQHDSGHGHIGDPHREQRTRRDEPKQDAVRAGAGQSQHVQHHPGAQPRDGEAGRQEEYADEEHHQRIAEPGPHGRGEVRDPERWNENQDE